jgi:hypothetical protein
MYSTPTTYDAGQSVGSCHFTRHSIQLNAIIRILSEKKLIRGKDFLNPDWVEWLMNWPIGWSSTDPLNKIFLPDQSIDPHPLIRRDTRIIKNRKERILALSNGQVALCASTAFKILSDEILN